MDRRKTGVRLAQEVSREREALIKLRRDLHAHPELALQEQRTAQVVTQCLESLGLEPRRTAGTGVVATLSGRRPGKTLLLRADMDGLPVVEKTSLSFKSTNAGVMHACGHDGHTSVLVTVATVLSRHREEFSGAVKFAFQPAEEQMSGARLMVEQGVLQDPQVDGALALHLWNSLPVSWVGVRSGPIFASVDDLRLRIKGRGGHGAMPHQTVDSIVVASQVVSALQTLVSREVRPGEPAVLTLGMIRGGTAFNIIPEEVEMRGTLRTYQEGVRQHLLKRIEEVVEGIAHPMHAKGEMEHLDGCPAVVNDEAMTSLVREVACQVVAEDKVVTVEPAMVGDDMAYFSERVPSCYFLVGSSNEGKGLTSPHHSPTFDFDEEALPIAAEILCQATLSYLG